MYISILLFSWSTLTVYTIYFIMYHTPSSRCVKYVLKIFHTKIMKYEIVLEKGLFASINGHLCLTKRHLDTSEGQVEVKFSLIKSCFWNLIQIKKKEFFWKRTLLNKASNLKMLFLPGIHPVSCQYIGLQLWDKFKHAVEAVSEYNACQ